MKDERRLLGLTAVNEKNAAHYQALLENIDNNRPFRDFQYVDPNWLRIFEIPGKVRLQVGYEPTAFRSRSQGGAYRLAWMERKPGDYSEFLRYFEALKHSLRKTDANRDQPQA